MNCLTISSRPVALAICRSRQLRPVQRAGGFPAAGGSVAARPPAAARPRRTALRPRAQAGSGSDSGNGNGAPKPEFGYTRKDVILIGVGLIGLGYVMYYGLQAMGMDAGLAGNWVQLTIFLGICVGWVGSYLFRVSTKQMTYARQLQDYEEAVMRKRLEELPEQELERLVEEGERQRQAQQQQQQRRQ